MLEAAVTPPHSSAEKQFPGLRVAHKASTEEIAETLEARQKVPLQDILHQADIASQVVATDAEGNFLITDQLPRGSKIPSGFAFMGDSIDRVLSYKRDAEVYTDILQYAKELYHDYLAEQPLKAKQNEDIRFVCAIRAINQAVAQKLGPGQKTSAYEEYLAKNPYTEAKEIRDLNLEVCLQKSLIFQEFLTSLNFPSKVCLEAKHEGEDDGHAYSLVFLFGRRQKLHGNMPHRGSEPETYEPNFQDFDLHAELQRHTEQAA